MEVNLESLENEENKRPSFSYDTIQKGVNLEQYSAQLYEQMSAFADKEGFRNTKKWFKIHASEERKHSDWCISYLEDKDEMPKFDTIKKPEIKFTDIEEMLNRAFEHEQIITDFWNEAACEYAEAHDHDSFQFCLYMIKEQREEIDLFRSLLDLYKLAGNNMIEFDKNMIHP